MSSPTEFETSVPFGGQVTGYLLKDRSSKMGDVAGSLFDSSSTHDSASVRTLSQRFSASTSRAATGGSEAADYQSVCDEAFAD
jgi:hypothetical protein